MRRTSVLTIRRISAEDRAKIAAVDPAIGLIDAGAGEGRARSIPIDAAADPLII
jgi:hypothetical protein